MPRELAFTIKCSVRSAWETIHVLLKCGPASPPVYQGQYDPKALLNQSAARALNVEVHSAEVRAIRAALEAGAQQHPGALITVEDPLTMKLSHRDRRANANAAMC